MKRGNKTVSWYNKMSKMMVVHLEIYKKLWNSNFLYYNVRGYSCTISLRAGRLGYNRLLSDGEKVASLERN